MNSPAPGSAGDPSGPVDPRITRDRLRTYLLGVGIGLIMLVMLLMMRAQMAAMSQAPDPAAPAGPGAAPVTPAPSR